MSSFADRQRRNVALIQQKVHSERAACPTCEQHLKRLSRSDLRTVAHLTGTAYTIVDGGPTGSAAEVTEEWHRWDFSVKMPPAPVEVYNAQTAPYGRIPAGVAVAENSAYLQQEANKREQRARAEQERQAARERRPKR